jgi:hypothetical protein
VPAGLGVRGVMDTVLCAAVAQHPDRHVLVVADRPAHALSHAQRLRTQLGLPTAVFCGGDFLYSFQRQFQARWDTQQQQQAQSRACSPRLAGRSCHWC